MPLPRHTALPFLPQGRRHPRRSRGNPWRGMGRLVKDFNGKTVAEILRGMMRHRLPSVASEMAFSGALALVSGVLAWTIAIALLPPSISRLPLVQEFPATLGFLNLGAIDPVPPSRLMLCFSGLFSFGCMARILHRAMHSFDLIYGVPAPQRRSFWLSQGVALGLTLLTVGLGLLMGSLIALSPSPDIPPGASPWDNGFRLGQQGLIAVGAMAIAAGAWALIYRWGVSFWLPGQPLALGAGLAAGMTALLTMGLQGAIAALPGESPLYDGLATLLWLYLSLLMGLLGAQVNATVAQQREYQRSQLRTQPRPAQPPSFEAFTIRRPPNHFL
jgi:membrane protein